MNLCHDPMASPQPLMGGPAFAQRAAPAAQDREVAKRWEELAEFRHQQLLLEEAQMLQLQEIDGGIIRDHRWVGPVFVLVKRNHQIQPVCICKQ